MKKLFLSLTVFMAFLSCGGAEVPPAPEPEKPAPTKYYRNPVMNTSMPDPTVIKAEDGWFYVYATEDVRNTPIYKSKDLINWKFAGKAFTEATRPTFEPGGGIWAPDINYINGKYVLYYSLSVWGDIQTCGIGVATSDKPEGPFTDHGKLFRSNEIGVTNSIDQFYIEDEGKKYLAWGSFWGGVHITELNDDGLSVKDMKQKTKLTGGDFEGTYIHKHDGMYYLFASVGTCCEGANSTYKLVVGRSESLFGKYVDKQGRAMLDNYYEVVIGLSDRFVGNGHCSEIVQDDNGDDWILYHSVDLNNPDGRVLMLNQIKWDKDGWPYVEGGIPAETAVAPYFKDMEK